MAKVEAIGQLAYGVYQEDGELFEYVSVIARNQFSNNTALLAGAAIRLNGKNSSQQQQQQATFYEDTRALLRAAGNEFSSNTALLAQHYTHSSAEAEVLCSCVFNEQIYSSLNSELFLCSECPENQYALQLDGHSQSCRNCPRGMLC